MVLQAKVLEQIADDSDGIFLWAKLVVSSIYQSVVHSRDHVGVEDLLRILSGFKGLEELFKELLRRATAVGGRRLQHYIQLLSLQRHWVVKELHLVRLTMARLSNQVNSYEKLAPERVETKCQIEAQSAGLLLVENRKRIPQGRTIR